MQPHIAIPTQMNSADPDPKADPDSKADPDNKVAQNM